MELDLGPEIEQFRLELRDWIAEHAPPALAGLIDWRMAAIPGGYRTPGLTKALQHPAYAQWEHALAGRQAHLPAVAGRVRRPGPGRGADRGAERGVLPGRGTAGDPRHGRDPGRPVGDRARQPRTTRVLPAPHHQRRGRLLPGLLRARPRIRPGRGADPRRDRRRRDRHHRAEAVDLGRGPGHDDVRPVPDGPGRRETPGPVLRADPVQRAAGPVPADQAAVRGGGVLRGLPGRRPRPAVQRDRRPEQRLAGGHDHARP